MPNLAALPPFTDDGDLQMVVETPRGATVKLKYEPAMRAFTVSRALSLGIAYPFDWGFIPDTLCEDGDPLDALAIHDGAADAMLGREERDELEVRVTSDKVDVRNAGLRYPLRHGGAHRAQSDESDVH